MIDAILRDPKVQGVLDGLEGNNEFRSDADSARIRRKVVTTLLRALAGETLDAAADAFLCDDEFCGHCEADDHPYDPTNCGDCRRIIIEGLTPLIRAPLLVQVAELEAQLAAAREAVKDICEWRQKWDCGDYSCQNGSCYKEDSTACEFFKRLDAALTGATQQ